MQYIVLSQVGARTLTSLWPRSFTLLWREDTEWVDLTTLLTTCMSHRSPSHVLHVLHMWGWLPELLRYLHTATFLLQHDICFLESTHPAAQPKLCQISIQKVTVWLFLILVTYGNRGLWWGRARNHDKISQPCPLSCSYLISESKQWSFNQVILVRKPILWLFCYVNFLTDLI